jgi:tetratricopeptide (TPR) repeat protein
VTRTCTIAACILLAQLVCGCDAMERANKRAEAEAELARAELALEQERLEDALAAFGRAFEIFRQIRETAGAARALTGRGLAAAGLERHERAVADFERARGLMRKAGEADESWLGMVHNLEGESLSALARWPAAERVFAQGLAAHERAYGKDDPRLLWSLRGLGWVAASRAEYDPALALLDRVESIITKTGYDDTIQVVACRRLRAEVLLRLGRYDEALSVARAALAKARARLAPDHTSIAACHNAVGYGLLRRGDAAAALEQFTAGRQILAGRFGESHLHTATMLDSEGEAKRELGRFEAALALHEQALGIRESRLAWDNDGTAWMIDNIGRAKLGLSRNEEALADFERAARMVEAIHGPLHHPDLARELHHQGLALLALGRPDRARSALHEALAIREQQLGGDHPEVKETREAIASLGQSDDLLL